MARPAGIPNVLSADFRQTVADLLHRNTGNVHRWLQLVAEGDARRNLKPDPARALDLIAKLAEFAVPRLQRTEIAGADGGALQVNVQTLALLPGTLGMARSVQTLDVVEQVPGSTPTPVVDRATGAKAPSFAGGEPSQRTPVSSQHVTDGSHSEPTRQTPVSSQHVTDSNVTAKPKRPPGRPRKDGLPPGSRPPVKMTVAVESP